MLTGLLRRAATPALAAALVITLGLVARQPATSAAERRSLTSQFAFERWPLNDDPERPRAQRTVAPGLAHIGAWISAVGASVALDDISNIGVASDRCLVDPRDDSVTIAPVPGTDLDYRPISLTPQPLAWSATTMAPMGCVPGDFDEDGLTDILVYYWGRSPAIFLRRPATPMGSGAFRAVELVSPTQVWNTTTVNLADVDGDGHVDVIVGNYFPDGAAVLDATADNDSLMEMQDSMSHASNAGVNRILLWSAARSGDGPSVAFREVRGLPDAATDAWTLAIGSQDLTGDLLPEIYFANDFGPDHLFVNHSSPGHVDLNEATGSRDWRAPKSKVLGSDSFKGMGVAFTDLNRDLVQDILVTNITSQFALQESNFAFVSTARGQAFRAAALDGRAAYSDESEGLGLARSGWSWDVKTGDFTNSGSEQIIVATGFMRGSTRRWPELQELAMGNDSLLHQPGVWPRFEQGDDLSGDEANRFFVRTESGRYVDLANDLGLTSSAVSRAVAVADVFGDGRLDFAVANQWGASWFYRNTAAVSPFVGLRLGIPTPAARDGANWSSRTRPAIGATVEVRRGDGVTLTKQLYPANGHTGVSGSEIMFGLGSSPAGRVDVLIRWRDGSGNHSLKRSLEPGWHSIELRPDDLDGPADE